MGNANGATMKNSFGSDMGVVKDLGREFLDGNISWQTVELLPSHCLEGVSLILEKFADADETEFVFHKNKIPEGITTPRYVNTFFSLRSESGDLGISHNGCEVPSINIFPLGSMLIDPIKNHRLSSYQMHTTIWIAKNRHIEDLGVLHLVLVV